MTLLSLSMTAHAQQRPQLLPPPPACPPEPALPAPSDGRVAALPPDCPNPPPPPPPTPPSTPSEISYPAYTDGNSVTVRWNGSSGATSYQLYESVNNGGYTLVYQGGALATTLSGKNQSILSYRVRACKNSTLCSGYRTGAQMAVNPRNVVDLYAKYPVLHTLDQRIAAYQSTAPSFRTVVPRAVAHGKGSGGVAARIMGDEQRFYLGDGYDVIRGELKENCLSVDHPQFVINKSPPQQPTTYSITHITDNRHLADVLDVSASAKLGFTDDDFNLGASGEQERYARAVTDESYERFVVKWTQRAEFWRLNTPTDAILPELTRDVLLPGSEPARVDFRERCGDKFINSVNLGATIYIVFTLDTKKYDAETRQSKKGTLGLVIGEIFNGSLAGSISSSNAQQLAEMNVRVHADQVGGPPGLAAGINSTNFNTKYNEFIQGSNINNWSAVDFTTSNYQRPTVYSAYTHDQIFADFTVPFAQARRWLDLTVQQRERCDPYSANSRTVPKQCGTAVTDLGIALDLCRETTDWALCQHPASYYPAFGTLNGQYLLGWLNDNIKRIVSADTTQTYNHHVHKGTLNVNDSTCLAHSYCFVNKFRGSGPGIGKGFTYTQHEYDNPKGSGPVHQLSNSDQCVNTTARLETGGFLGDTTADLDYTMKVEGFCANDEAFSIVQ
ncbi:MAG: hypothetical protein ABW171_04590 [Steroidobacter sp.]